jgi:hypothetical protein
MESGPPLTQRPTFKGFLGPLDEADLAATSRRNGTSTEGFNLTPILMRQQSQCQIVGKVARIEEADDCHLLLQLSTASVVPSSGSILVSNSIPTTRYFADKPATNSRNNDRRKLLSRDLYTSGSIKPRLNQSECPPQRPTSCPNHFSVQRPTQPFSSPPIPPYEPVLAFQRAPCLIMDLLPRRRRPRRPDR